MEHLIVQLGTLLGACAVLAIAFDKIKQSSILAFITVGVVASGTMRQAIYTDRIRHQRYAPF